MRFTVVGAGALGTILSVHLAAAGHDVRTVARGARAEMLRARGMNLYGLRNAHIPCLPAISLSRDENNGVIIYAVKTYHMEHVLEAAQNISCDAVFSVANGVEKKDQLAKFFPRDKILGCMANFSGELEEDGRVHFTRNVCLYLGGGDVDTAKSIASVLQDSGLNTEYSSRIESVEWSKFVGWLAFFVIAVTSRSATGSFLMTRPLAKAVVTIIKECSKVAEAVGISLEDHSPMPVKSIAQIPIEDGIEQVQKIGREFDSVAPGHRMSSLQDLEAGRELEVEGTLGYMVRKATEYGIETPILSFAYDLASGLNDLS